MRTLIERVARAFLEDAAAVRWAVFSVGSFCMVFGLTALCHEVLHLGERLAFLVPLVAVFFVNFFVCRHLVYRSAGGAIWNQFVGYGLSTIGFRASEYAAYCLLCNALRIWYIQAVLIVLPTSFIAKFVFFKLLVFRPPAASPSPPRTAP